ncbi:hypothetical protein ARMSODRAFT_961000, partial [Armillaria solidipes]
MVILIFIGAPPPSYARMQTRLSTSKRAEQTRQPRQDNGSSPLDPEPTTPSNHSVASDDDEQLSLSDDDNYKDDPRQAASKDKAKVKNTPCAHGSASHLAVELQTQDGQNHKFDEAHAYLKDDLRHRIFIEFETFLVNILHLPTNWRISLKSDIAAVQKDKDFRKLFGVYLRLCDVVGTGLEKERELYRPHADLCNHVIDVLQGRPTSMVPEGDLIRFDRIDPYVVRGSTEMVKPDIVGMLRMLFSTPGGIAAQEFINTIGDKSNTVVDEANAIGDKSKEPKSKRKHTNYIPGWPHVLEVKEMKGTDDTIDEGYDAIRLKTKDGKDPLTTRPQKNRTYLKDKANVVDLSCQKPAPEVETSQGGSRGRKRKAEPGNEESSSKMSRLSKTVSSKGKVVSGRQKVLDEEGFAPGTDRAEKARVQCARYALHILSNAGLRSHALVTLIDRDRIQLSYYDRSAIIVSQAIDLGNEDDEILFIAMLIGCHRLTLKQRGIYHDIIKDPYITDFNRFNKVSKDAKILFSGLQMTLQKDNKDITLILGTTVYHQRGLFGRDTCWKGNNLVVKISRPSTSRNKTFDFEADSAQKLITKMVHAGEYVERVLCITVLEELLPITSLRKDSDYAQVFVDILQCHNMANIMYRVDSAGNIFGVLNDFDLSSLIPIEEATSLRRTGTPPYMAFDLLKEEKDSGPHLYRHDLEALFYVMLMICCRHSIIKKPQPHGTSQLEEISANFSEHRFFFSNQPLPVSECFEAFRPCLNAIRRKFTQGLFARQDAKDEAEAASWKAPPLPADINVDR